MILSITQKSFNLPISLPNAPIRQQNTCDELMYDFILQVRGSHVGTYLPSSGVWHHTQRHLKQGDFNPKTVHHLDFDAPTREHAHLLPDDKVILPKSHTCEI